MPEKPIMVYLAIEVTPRQPIEDIYDLLNEFEEWIEGERTVEAHDLPVEAGEDKAYYLELQGVGTSPDNMIANARIRAKHGPNDNITTPNEADLYK